MWCAWSTLTPSAPRLALVFPTSPRPARPWSAEVTARICGPPRGWRELAWVSGMLCETRRRRQPDPIVVVDISARARRRDSS
jgi:hypothetical protein